jgi:uncharacterized protein (DUF58 family)
MLIRLSYQILSNCRQSACIPTGVRYALLVTCLIYLSGGRVDVWASGRTGPSKAQASQAAHAVVDETRYDFGEVFKGEALNHTFKVRNTGVVPLKLNDAAPVTVKKKSTSLYRGVPTGPVRPPQGLSFPLGGFGAGLPLSIFAPSEPSGAAGAAPS